jgi:hypothetical protein
VRRLIVTAPDIIPGQPDMLPSERGDMLGELRPDVASFAAQPVARSRYTGVPQDNGGDQEIEAGGSIGLAFEAPVSHFAKPIEEDCPGEAFRASSLLRPALVRRRRFIFLNHSRVNNVRSVIYVIVAITAKLAVRRTMFGVGVMLFFLARGISVWHAGEPEDTRSEGLG